MNSALPYRSPTSLLKELGITEPEEICIEAIAQYCNATILYKPLSGSAARILGLGERALITVDSKAKRARQRFSAAHEVGHWMRDRHQMSAVFSCQEQVFAREWGGQDNPERRANRYAAELLLPEFIFKPKAKDLPITFTSVQQLTATFQTSLTATAIRLVELGSFPSLIVCHSAQKRLWFVKDADFPSAIRLRDKPGAYTIAYDLLRGTAAEHTPTDVQADGWITHSDSHRYTLREDSIRISAHEVLTLLWWKDERQLLDLMEEDE